MFILSYLLKRLLEILICITLSYYLSVHNLVDFSQSNYGILSLMFFISSGLVTSLSFVFGLKLIPFLPKRDEIKLKCFAFLDYLNVTSKRFICYGLVFFAMFYFNIKLDTINQKFFVASIVLYVCYYFVKRIFKIYSAVYDLMKLMTMVSFDIVDKTTK